MSDEPNMCELIFNHELAMRRLISLLRQSQSECNDSECFQFTPSNTRTGAGDDGVMMMTLCWLAIIVFLYLFRPSALKNRVSDTKPRNDRNGGGSDPSSPVL